MRYRSSAAQRAFGALFRFARQPFLLVRRAVACASVYPVLASGLRH